MRKSKGVLGDGRPSDENLPDSIQVPLKVIRKQIPLFPNAKYMLALVLADLKLLETWFGPANVSLMMRELFVGSVYESIRCFIEKWYKAQVSANDIFADYHADSAARAAMDICRGLYDGGIAADLRKRFIHYCIMFAGSGLHAPVDIAEYGNKLFRYFMENSIPVKENGQTVSYSIASVSGSPSADEFLKTYDAVNKAFEMTMSAFFIIVSNAVYTRLPDHIFPKRKSSVMSSTVCSLIEAAAGKEADELCFQYTQAAENDALIARVESGVSDMALVDYCFGPRPDCNIVNRLLAVGAILDKAERYRAKNNGVDERTREEILRARCSVRNFYREFIAAGMTGVELLEWVVVHLYMTLAVPVPPYSAVCAEKWLRANGLFDTPIIKALPSDWDQQHAGDGCSEEDVHRAFISHYTGKLRVDILPKNSKGKESKKA